ncbi:MAG: DUF2520 domain-containing protein [Bacteroidales bacterium]|nr:DUF2520 domain-containing protein [Bacteroidales bacterium]
MRISFIGSGNVATHLALAMRQRGHVVAQIWSRNLQHAQALANRVEAQPIDDLSLLDTKANVYILAVSDDALFDIAPLLHLGNAVVVHTSGATSMDILKDTSTRYGVVWSPQSFVRDVAIEYNELPFCIEGCDKDTEDYIEEFIGMISTHIYRTTHQQRQYLHLASVFVNNFTNGIYAVAQQLCWQHNVPFEILYPIINTTAKRIQWGDVRYQLTGPAIRGDEKTLATHRQLLADDPQTLMFYDEFTKLLQLIKL